MSTNKLLRQVADRLPPLPKKILKEVKKLTGLEILTQFPDAVYTDPATGKQSPLIKHEYYAWPVQTILSYQNHFMKLKELNQSNGVDAINEYIEQCFQYNNMKNPGIKLTVKPKDNVAIPQKTETGN